MQLEMSAEVSKERREESGATGSTPVRESRGSLQCQRGVSSLGFLKSISSKCKGVRGYSQDPILYSWEISLVWFHVVDPWYILSKALVVFSGCCYFVLFFFFLFPFLKSRNCQTVCHGHARSSCQMDGICRLAR